MEWCCLQPGGFFSTVTLLWFLCWFQVCSTGIEDFLPFGPEAGDALLSSDTGQLSLEVPVVFYGTPETELHINSDGLLSFGRPLPNTAYMSGLNITLPHEGEPGSTEFLAPFWSSLAMNRVDEGGGVIAYRNSSSSSQIEQALQRLSGTVEDFAPRLLVVVTWDEVALDNTDQTQNVTFQVILLTDGILSFSTFIYGPITSEADYLVGFNAGDRVRGVVLSSSDQAGSSSAELQTTSFRIDGQCVTSASELLTCSLNSFPTLCSAPPSLSALQCNCRTGYRNTTGSCQDIDECTEAVVAGNAICPEGSSDCVNLNGSFQCPCKEGFFGNNLTVCEDQDECIVGLHSCDVNAECRNTFGGFNCTCNSGFLGDGNVCIEEAVLVPCTEGVGDSCTCVGEGSSRQCYCDRGFNMTTSSNGTCQDVDECVLGTAPCNQMCLNTAGSFTCVCLPGFHLDADGITCEDIDECETQLHNCAPEAECTDSDGTFTCQCGEGLVGNGQVCFEDGGNVCDLDNHGCEQVCFPTSPGEGYFRCLCLPGYLLGDDGASCDDLDECASGLDNCDSRGQCTNTVGSFQCSCGEGFYGNGVLCQDIDECSLNLHDCGQRNCTNTMGGFTCSCPDMLFPSPTDPEQCIRGKPPNITVIPVVRPISQYLYSIGNNFCLETTTQNLSELITIDLFCQPEEGIFPAPQSQWSIRIDFTNGSVALPRIILPDSTFLASFNDTHLTFGPVQLRNLGLESLGLVFRFECTLINSLDSHVESTILRMCEPNQCQDGITNNCTSLCSRSVDDDHTCSCEDGFNLAQDGVTCEDIDECSQSLCSKGSTTCINTVGSFMCECTPGFVEHESPLECEDIDECDLQMDNCSLQQDLLQCENLLGSFECVCTEGYDFAPDGLSCVDVNECSRSDFNSCSSLEVCNNMIGSFQCVCMEGYERSSDGGCEDVDECIASPCIGGVCNNTVGSFACLCMDGMQLDTDSVTCSDIDECASPTSPCGANSQCSNIMGSFDCTCNSLYRSVGDNCEISLTILVPVIVVTCVLLIAVVLVAMFLVGRWRLKAKYSVQKPEENENAYLPANAVQMPHLAVAMEMAEISLIPAALIISTRELSLENKVLGAGEFGIVHKAKYRNEIVAVKTMKGFFNDSGITDLVDEILKMKDFSHSNILTLMGVALDSRHTPCLVMPFMSNGSLCEYLRKEEVRKELLWGPNDPAEVVSIASQKLTNFCWQIAKGMEYLSRHKVIHRDLAARNCMLDMNHVVKVADFGLSVSMADDKNYFRAGEDAPEKLPVKWMAPESLMDRKFSELSDVWAFGVTCWEVFSCGKVPYPTIKAAELLLEIRNGHTLCQPENGACSNTMYKVMLECWAYTPAERPKFSTLVGAIGENLEENAGYFPLSPALISQMSSLLKIEDLVSAESAIVSNHPNNSSDADGVVECRFNPHSGSSSEAGSVVDHREFIRGHRESDSELNTTGSHGDLDSEPDSSLTVLSNGHGLGHSLEPNSHNKESGQEYD